MSGRATERCPAVLLAAHGAGDDSAANTDLRDLARRLAERLEDSRVGVGFVLGTPGVAEAAAWLRRAAGGAVVVVPVFVAEGHFVRHRLPTLLALPRPGVELTAPLGTHRRVVGAVVAGALARLHAAARSTGSVGCLVVGHGTARSARSAASTEALACALRAAAGRAGLAVEVATAYLDQAPLLEDVAAGLAVERLVVVPFLLGGGPHLARDLGERLERATPSRCDVGRGLLEDPALAHIVLAALVDRVRTASRARYRMRTVEARVKTMRARWGALENGCAPLTRA